MKKLTALLLALLLAFCTFAMAEVKSVPELGFEIDIPKTAGTPNYTIAELTFDDLIGIQISFYNAELLDPIFNELQDAVVEGDAAKATELRTQARTLYAEHTAVYYNIIGIETANIDTVLAAYDLTNRDMTEIGSNSTHTYFAVKGLENDTLTEEDKALMEASRAEVDAMVASVKIIEIGEREAISAFPAFETVDMDGNTVTEDIFSQADLTIVHVWGTFCSPCISEMPKLAAWANELPEGVQIIGVLSDVKAPTDKTFATAEKILSRSGATFTNILNSDGLSPFMQGVTGTPTTFFFDRNGNPVHDPIVGAYFNQYQDAVAEIMGN